MNINTRLILGFFVLCMMVFFSGVGFYFQLKNLIEPVTPQSIPNSIEKINSMIDKKNYISELLYQRLLTDYRLNEYAFNKDKNSLQNFYLSFETLKNTMNVYQNNYPEISSRLRPLMQSLFDIQMQVVREIQNNKLDLFKNANNPLYQDYKIRLNIVDNILQKYNRELGSDLIDKNIATVRGAVQNSKLILENSLKASIFIFLDALVIAFLFAFYTTRSISNEVLLRKRLETELLHLATNDGLTGLPTRGLLLDRIHQAIAIAKRNKTFVAVLFIDLDSFKQVNDQYGHDAGDELLKLFSSRLKQNTREADSVGRLGGDEFLAVLHITSVKKGDLLPIINKYFEILMEPYPLTQHVLTLTSSIGISVYPFDGEEPLELINHADMAMYQAKEQGKSAYSFYNKKLMGI